MVRSKALARGAEGRCWLEALPATIGALADEWGLAVGCELTGNTESYVVEATTRDGEVAVLKIALPGRGAADEIETLRLADGRGYVRLLRHDARRGAMLEERLGPQLAELGLSVDAQIEHICATLRQAWTAPPAPHLQTGAEKAHALGEYVAATWEELGRPCAERVVERALDYARAREDAFDPDHAALVHGDAHAVNTLRASDGTFRLVDPDGMFAERAVDLAVPMREWNRELLAGDPLRRGQDRCALLGRLTGVETGPIWEWGFLERASTGLLCLQVGLEVVGRDMLAVAETFAANGGS